MEWTIKSVKEQLPEVKIKLGDIIYTGKVRGSKLEYAHVHVTVLGFDHMVEVAWKTIVDCLNNDRYIVG